LKFVNTILGNLWWLDPCILVKIFNLKTDQNNNRCFVFASRDGFMDAQNTIRKRFIPFRLLPQCHRVYAFGDYNIIYTHPDRPL